jgi:hypothetical protein
MSEPQKKKRFNLPRDFDNTDRSKAASLIIDRIVQRTTNNLDSDGKRFKNYSEAYAESLEFKIAGKSKNDPNLTLSGDMLNSIQVIESNPGYVTLGYNEGTPENDKATWAERSDNGPARKFLGLTEKELDQIVSEIRTDRPRALDALSKDELATKAGKAVTDQIVKNIFKNLGMDTEEE